MEARSYIYGILTAVAIAAVIFGIKSLANHAKEVREMRVELTETTDSLNEYKSENKKLRDLLEENNVSEYEIKNKITEYGSN